MFIDVPIKPEGDSTVIKKKSCLMSCVEVGISLSTSLSLSEIVGGCDVMFNCMDPFAPLFTREPNDNC